jgi:hypothetical protein
MPPAMSAVIGSATPPRATIAAASAPRAGSATSVAVPMAAMAPWMWFGGFLAILVLAFTFPNPIILLIALFAGFETWQRWRRLRRGDEETRAYYRVRSRDRAIVAGVYLGLIALLVLGMDATHVERTLDDV